MDENAALGRVWRPWSVGLMLLLAPFAAAAGEKTIVPGQAAPEFALMDQSGTTRTLAAYRGQWVVLYFYPKDDTPGCTTEACQFRDDFVSIQKLGATILGVSVDSRESHAEFARKYHLPFPLLADTEGAVAKQYGALWGSWPLRFARRHTFLIDPRGRIARIYREVNPQTHSREIMADLTAAQRTGARSP